MQIEPKSAKLVEKFGILNMSSFFEFKKVKPNEPGVKITHFGTNLNQNW